MLGALGALIRKDKRTLFQQNSDGLLEVAPQPSDEIMSDFLEELGPKIWSKFVRHWPLNPVSTSMEHTSESHSDSEEEGSDIGSDILTSEFSETILAEFKASDLIELKSAFEYSTLRVLYTADESHEWVVYTPLTEDKNLRCLAGVYQKFNFEFGDGKFHHIISMGSTRSVPWSVTQSSAFDPSILHYVGTCIAHGNEALNATRCHSSKKAKHTRHTSLDTVRTVKHARMQTVDGLSLPSMVAAIRDDSAREIRVPNEIWHEILTFAVDCFAPINNMVDSDVVLEDSRRNAKNLYLSSNLKKMHDRKADPRIRLFGLLFHLIGCEIDHAYFEYKKQFSFYNRSKKAISAKWISIKSTIGMDEDTLTLSDDSKEKGKPSMIKRSKSLFSMPSKMPFRSTAAGDSVLDAVFIEEMEIGSDDESDEKCVSFFPFFFSSLSVF